EVAARRRQEQQGRGRLWSARHSADVLHRCRRRGARPHVRIELARPQARLAQDPEALNAASSAQSSVQRNQCAAARGATTAHARSTKKLPVGNDAPARTLRTLSESAAAGSARAKSSNAPGRRANGYAIPPRKSSTRKSPFAIARFASARNVPASNIPMPANAIVPNR